MPRVKKKNNNDENSCPLKNFVPKIRRKPVFKFDAKKILKNRQAENELLKKKADFDEEMKIVNDLFQAEVENSKKYEEEKCAITSKLVYSLFDYTKFNVHFNKNSDLCMTKSWSQQLLLMSIEEDELKANINFKNLFDANWLPGMSDIQNVLCNWGTNLDTLMNQPLQKCQVYGDGKIGRHNFELVLRFIWTSILRNNHGFSKDDMLKLAKFTVTLSFDYHCGQMINVIKYLFCTLIETALHENDDTDVIAFAQELFSQHEEGFILKKISDLFLPLHGNVMKTIYTYLTYKLFKTLLGKTNNTNVFPTHIKDWFVQDLVTKDYFDQNSKRLLYGVIQLLEHVVIVFDLYQDKERLSKMYEFLTAAIRSKGLSDSLNLVNILDQWKLRLFRLHIMSKTAESENILFG